MHDLSEMQQLLLMAALTRGLHPKRKLTANCAGVVGTALRWAGLVTPEVKEAWNDDFNYHPVIRDCYGILIGMIQHKPASEALFEGAGNFGTPSHPITKPHFTACRLTELGVRVAKELLEQHPEYRGEAP